MTLVIIFQNADGGVSVILPTQEALASHTITEVALKDVPAGKPFKIINASELPTDRANRNLWTVDTAMLTDGVGGSSDEFGV